MRSETSEAGGQAAVRTNERENHSHERDTREIARDEEEKEHIHE